MTFYRAYKDQAGNISYLGPLRETVEEALEDLRDNDYDTSKMNPGKYGIYYSPAQQVGISVTKI